MIVHQPQSTVQPATIHPKIYALYDEYCHGAMDRREFLAKASAIAVGGMAMAQASFRGMPALKPFRSPIPGSRPVM